MGARESERGHLMVGLMAAVAIMVILSTAAFQAWEDILRRENEAEMMFRAREIARACRKYQKDRGTYPLELKQLMEPGNRGQYFLRRLYKDPLVRDGKWGLIFLGPNGEVYDPHATATGETDAAAADEGPVGMPATVGPGGTLTWGGTGATPRPGQVGGGGEQGLPIMGVKSLCTKKPFRVYNEKTEYAEWWFTAIDPELLAAIPGLPSQGRPPGTGLPPGGTPPGSRPIGRTDRPGRTDNPLSSGQR